VRARRARDMTWHEHATYIPLEVEGELLQEVVARALSLLHRLGALVDYTNPGVTETEQSEKRPE
jgi:uncharacterized membrane protein